MTKGAFKFETDAAAWKFMRTLDDAGIMVGFPELKAPVVHYAARNWVEREAARVIAEFHGGSIAAADLPGGDGVALTVRIPLAWK